MEKFDEFSDRVYKVRFGNIKTMSKYLSENANLFPNAKLDMMLKDNGMFEDVIVFETPEDLLLYKLKFEQQGNN